MLTITGADVHTVQPSAIESVSGLQKPEAGAHPGPRRPVLDEYAPEEKREPSGLYWPETDENGGRRICFDAAGVPEESPEGGKPEKNEPEVWRGNTDKVDSEIEKIKKKIEELKRQAASETDAEKQQKLERELAQLERELSRKDTDAYRRQRMEISEIK